MRLVGGARQLGRPSCMHLHHGPVHGCSGATARGLASADRATASRSRRQLWTQEAEAEEWHAGVAGWGATRYPRSNRAQSTPALSPDRHRSSMADDGDESSEERDGAEASASWLNRRREACSAVQRRRATCLRGWAREQPRGRRFELLSPIWPDAPPPRAGAAERLRLYPRARWPSGRMRQSTTASNDAASTISHSVEAAFAGALAFWSTTGRERPSSLRLYPRGPAGGRVDGCASPRPEHPAMPRAPSLALGRGRRPQALAFSSGSRQHMKAVTSRAWLACSSNSGIQDRPRRRHTAQEGARGCNRRPFDTHYRKPRAGRHRQSN